MLSTNCASAVLEEHDEADAVAIPPLLTSDIVGFIYLFIFLLLSYHLKNPLKMSMSLMNISITHLKILMSQHSEESSVEGSSGLTGSSGVGVVLGSTSSASAIIMVLAVIRSNSVEREAVAASGLVILREPTERRVFNVVF